MDTLSKGGWFTLNNPVVFELKGRDATRYLQNRSTNDVRAASETRALLAAVLSPQGKTEGIYTIIRCAPETYLLVCEGQATAEDREKMKSDLLRYKVAERLDCTDRSESYRVLHVFGEQQGEILSDLHLTSAPEFTSAVSEGGQLVAVRRNRCGALGVDIITPSDRMVPPSVERCCGLTPPLSESEFLSLRIQANRPLFGVDLGADVMFAEIPLSSDAVSFTKGCYVGQEVMAKVDALGKPPRVVCPIVIDTDRAPASETAVLHGTRTVGKILTSVASSDPERVVALALVKNDEGILNSELLVSEKGARRLSSAT